MKDKDVLNTINHKAVDFLNQNGYEEITLIELLKTNSIPVIAIDGNAIFYNPEAFEKLSEEEIYFSFLLMYMSLGQLEKLKQATNKIAMNTASNVALTSKIIEMNPQGIKIPSESPYFVFQEYAGKNVDEIYALLEGNFPVSEPEFETFEV